MVRDFVAAGLVDHLHLVPTPIVLGRGARIWDGLEALEDTYDIESVSSPSGVTHLTFTKRTADRPRASAGPPGRGDFRQPPIAPVCSPALPGPDSPVRAAGCGAAW